MKKGKQVKQENPLSCASRVLNFTNITLKDRFDKPRFDKEHFIKTLEFRSPKLKALLSKIRELDARDYSESKKLYKHFIYSGVGNGYGSKIIASALVAAGYDIVISKKGNKVTIDPILLKNPSESKFAVLSSTALYNTPPNPLATKEILKVFNERPENVYGQKIRFIILDSGFKEGIDLYDVKYCHIFEDQLYKSDMVQAQGRALRFRGQCGLPFNKGWVLDVFKYSSIKVINESFLNTKKENIIKEIQKLDTELIFRIGFQESLTEIIQKNAIDSDLNKNVNQLNRVKFKPKLLTFIKNLFSWDNQVTPYKI